jgi:hypothetical protein
MDIRALSRQGYTYAEIGRLVGRDWRTVKRYLESVYRRRRMPSKLDPVKPLIDQWLAAEPRLQPGASGPGPRSRVRGQLNTVRPYVERSRPRPPRRPEERFETAPGFQAQVDWSHKQPIRTSSGLELPLYAARTGRGRPAHSPAATPMSPPIPKNASSPVSASRTAATISLACTSRPTRLLAFAMAGSSSSIVGRRAVAAARHQNPPRPSRGNRPLLPAEPDEPQSILTSADAKEARRPRYPIAPRYPTALRSQTVAGAR